MEPWQWVICAVLAVGALKVTWWLGKLRGGLDEDRGHYLRKLKLIELAIENQQLRDELTLVRADLTRHLNEQLER